MLKNAIIHIILTEILRDLYKGSTMELAVKDLNRYCNDDCRNISQERFEAAHDYLHTLVFVNPEATPPKPLRKFFDRDLIKTVKELAADALVEKTSGRDRLQRTLIGYANDFNWAQTQLEAGLKYLYDLHESPTARYNASSLTKAHAEYIKDLSFQYGNVYA